MTFFRKGQILFKDYVFVKKLGEGANATVVEAKKNNNYYAIKIQNTDGIFGNIPRFELIMNEINILQNVPRTKYFTPLIEYYIDNVTNKSYIVTELINNSIPLDVYIKKYKYDIPIMFNISKQLCESIYLLHKSNICHGDFFPKNVMICPNTLNIKIIDFGSGYFLNDSSFVSYFNKKENDSKDKVSAQKNAKTEDLVFLGMTIYTLITYGRDLNRDYVQTQNTCGISSFFENKIIMYELVNACHISDEFYKISKKKKLNYYKSLSTLLYPYYKILSTTK
jgi:serine/threonine protein kinase